MAITLTDFEALSNFASVDEINFFLENIEVFRSIFTQNSIENF